MLCKVKEVWYNEAFRYFQRLSVKCKQRQTFKWHMVMLFYNIQKHCYVVIEIKTRAFEPGDMGQLGTYIVATDGILRGENDNATIGLLICKTKDNVESFYVA